MDYLVWIVAALGLVSLIGVFCRMQGGFGPFNIRAIGIVIVATFATLLALKDNCGIAAAMGILGAIGGYVFGIRDPKDGNSN